MSKDPTPAGESTAQDKRAVAEELAAIRRRPYSWLTQQDRERLAILELAEAAFVAHYCPG